MNTTRFTATAAKQMEYAIHGFNAKFHAGVECQWGTIQSVEHPAPGIVLVDTAGHGGFIVSAGRLASMDAKYRACSFTKDRNFEEDCSWCAVVMQWPEYFTPDLVKAAGETYMQCYLKPQLSQSTGGAA